MKFLNKNLDEDNEEIIKSLINEFISILEPLEKDFYVLIDYLINAYYIEIHVKAEQLIKYSTIDVPLDPDEQEEYRANREVVEDHNAFIRMKDDAKGGRTFSNIITEFDIDNQENTPLKIIGGQHRFIAIQEALEYEKINNYHGIKVYFNLNSIQRLDIQVISNTNILVSPDLLDRMFETVKGPQLRNWCQKVGFLEENQDFADKKQRTSQITVRLARSFILSYYEGRKNKEKKFEEVNPKPIIATTGGKDELWEDLQKKEDIWGNKKLVKIASEYNLLHKKQVDYYIKKRNKNLEYAYKAFNYSVITAWAYIAGILEDNNTRLNRHLFLNKVSNVDPLNANMLAKGKHKTDPENYRGLGARTDKKERGRLSELFYLQAEKGKGITKKLIDVAIMKYHVKLANLELKEAESKLI